MTNCIVRDIVVCLYPDFKNFNEALRIDKARAIDIMKDIVKVCQDQGDTKQIDGVKILTYLMTTYKDNEFLFAVISFFAIANAKIK